MDESRVEAWDRMERENADLRRALAPFARVAVTPLRFANVRYGTDADPERQTYQTPSMHRAFNRAAELLRAHVAGATGTPAPRMLTFDEIDTVYEADRGNNNCFQTQARDLIRKFCEVNGIAGVVASDGGRR